MGRRRLVRNREPVPTDEFYYSLWSVEGDLVRFALKLTSRNYHDAEDLLQETYLKALPHRERFHSLEVTDVKRWAFGIMRNAFYDMCNDKSPRDDGAELPQISCEHPSEQTQVLGDIIVEAALQKLPENYRVPLMLRLEGDKITEIAKELDLKESTARSIMSTGYRKVREILGYGPKRNRKNGAYDGNEAKRIREYAGLNLTDVAEEIGCDKYSCTSLVSQFERGIRAPANPPRGEVSKRYVEWLKGHGYNPFNL